MPDDRSYPATPLVGVSAAIWRDGAVLLAQRGREPLAGLWSLPGGLLRTGERLHDAIARELAEETSVEAELRGTVDTVEIIRNDEAGLVSHHYIVTVFAGFWRRGEAIAMDDAAAVRWCHPEHLSNFPLTEGTAHMIEKTARFLKIERFHTDESPN